jgi:protein-S-isoprenylcysteine O-methyltransferase Ste14
MMTWTNINLALWMLVGLVWFGGALSSRRTVQRESIAARGRYLVFVILGMMLLFSHILARELPWLERRLWPDSSAAGIAGNVLTAVGIGIAIWARLTLGKLWSGTITLKEGHRLVTSGPYAFARHPIYTGFLTACLGSAIVLGELRGFIGLALTSFGFILKLSAEDRLMESQFGDEHREYSRRVRRLIPFVY